MREVAGHQLELEAAPRASAREVGQLINHPPHTLAALDDTACEPRAPPRKVVSFSQQLRGNDDAVQGIAQVMSDDAEQPLPKLRCRPKLVTLAFRRDSARTSCFRVFLRAQRGQDQLFIRFELVPQHACAWLAR